MPFWCPKCSSMLPEGLEKCPVCGARLPPPEKTSQKYSRDSEHQGDQPVGSSEIRQITAFLLSTMLIPVIVIIILGLVCAVIVNLGN